MKIKNFKKSARKNLLRNYWVILFATLTILFLTNKLLPYQIKSPGVVTNNKVFITDNLDVTNYILNDLFGSSEKVEDLNKKHQVTEGIFHTLFDFITKGRQLVFDFIKNSSFLNNSMNAALLLILSYGLQLIVKVFLINPLKVGETRFYLENKQYPKTLLKRIFTAYHPKSYGKIVWTSFVKSVYQLLWDLTIVGGIIKHYAYLCVPYILADNPELSATEAITLSRMMMNHHKWDAFKLDCSFLGWKILEIITFQLSKIFYSYPYYHLTFAEFYLNVRKCGQKLMLEGYFDEQLDKENNCDYYPTKSAQPKPSFITKVDYYHHYGILDLILFFFVFSFVGWIWEVFLYFFRDSIIVNRGVFYGPWLPIYGAGCTLILMLLIPKNNKKLTDKPIITFVVIMIICGIIEYATSWYLEWANSYKWWDYSGNFLNLNGRICLEGLLFFGLGGCACLYVVAPHMYKWFQKIPKATKAVTAIFLTTIFMIDFIYASFYPHTGTGITTIPHIQNVNKYLEGYSRN